jgi:hypothetical protein
MAILIPIGKRPGTTLRAIVSETKISILRPLRLTNLSDAFGLDQRDLLDSCRMHLMGLVAVAGMHISLRHRTYSSPVTVLSGRLGDQTQLTVMLDNLIKKHLPILSVAIVKPKSEADGGSPIDQ